MRSFSEANSLTSGPVDATAAVLDWDLVDGVLKAREHGLPVDDSGALNFIVRESLTANGHFDPDQKS